MTSVLTVVGARPQFIKVAPVSRALRDAGIHEQILHTGQHYDFCMSEVFFEELRIASPQFNLNIRETRHGAMTGKMLAAIEDVLIEERPDYVVVYGDTNSTLAAALAAAKLHIPLAHVEAGLRSWNRAMPEEVNRVLTDHISGLLFCPSAVSANNLKGEGIAEGVHIVGDVMADANLLACRIVEKSPEKYLAQLPQQLRRDPYGIFTLHRAENTDHADRLTEIVDGINALKTPIVFPLHPRTAKCLEKNRLQFGSHVHLLSPVSYLEMTALLANATFALTDSGGLQKEAYWLEVPCFTLREETEWVETTEQGWNRLIRRQEFPQISTIIDKALSAKPTTAPDAYGDGAAAKKIALELTKSH